MMMMMMMMMTMNDDNDDDDNILFILLVQNVSAVEQLQKENDELKQLNSELKGKCVS